MSSEKHGLIGGTIKVIMVFVFTLIGAGLVTLGALYWGKGWDIGTESGKEYNIRWLSICNVVFGACLLTSPFFLNNKREGLAKFIKILMVIIFVIIGVALITGGAIALAKNYYEANQRWLPICNLVFGCLLFTFPFFLKK